MISNCVSFSGKICRKGQIFDTLELAEGMLLLALQPNAGFLLVAPFLLVDIVWKYPYLLSVMCGGCLFFQASTLNRTDRWKLLEYGECIRCYSSLVV